MSDDQIRILLSDLQSLDRDTSLGAVIELEDRLEVLTSHLRELAPAIESPDARVRSAAIDLVRQMGAKAAILAPQISERLRDSESSVRSGAAEALALIAFEGDPFARSLLFGALAASETVETRETAATGVGLLGRTGADALPQILDLLESGDQSLCFSAVSALKNMRDRAAPATPVLEAILVGSDERLAHSIRSALARIYGIPAPPRPPGAGISGGWLPFDDPTYQSEAWTISTPIFTGTSENPADSPGDETTASTDDAVTGDPLDEVVFEGDPGWFFHLHDKFEIAKHIVEVLDEFETYIPEENVEMVLHGLKGLSPPHKWDVPLATVPGVLSLLADADHAEPEYWEGSGPVSGYNFLITYPADQLDAGREILEEIARHLEAKLPENEY